MDWVTEALHQSHADEKRFRDEAIAPLHVEHSKIQNRLDKLYEDRLDVSPTFDLIAVTNTAWQNEKAARVSPDDLRPILAPQVGLEPTTLRLTAECSAIELLRNKRPHIARTMCRARKSFYNRWVSERQGEQF
jgi:hypothetical protein